MHIRRALPWVVLAAVSCRDSGSSPEPGTPSLVRGPFVAAATTTSILIAWSTDAEGIGEVEYGLPGGPTARTAETEPARSHTVALAGLDPATAYGYAVRTAGIVLVEGRSFRTARPASDAAVRFAAFGDIGPGPHQDALAERIREAAPDLVLITGDTVYPEGQASGFDPFFFEPYGDLIDHIPFYPVLGNHDILTGDGAPFLGAFRFPPGSPDGGRSYSFEAGGALFIALDSNRGYPEGSAGREWLAGELARSADWKFVYFHHPLYSSGPHGGSEDLRAQLEALFESAGVDLVLNGHDHDYERTFPMLDGQPVDPGDEPHYTSPAGIVHIVAGAGGRSLYQKETDNAFSAAFRSVYSVVLVETSGRDLTLRAISEDGAEIDAMTISK